MRIRSVEALSMIAAAVSGAAFADGTGLPPVPERTFAGCINGRVNIWLAKEGSLTNHWFQMRLPHEAGDAWRTVGFTRHGNNDPGFAYSAAADFPGTAYFRVAETNAAGEHAGWLTVGPVTNHVRHTGWTRGVKGNSYTSYVADGIVSTCQESSPQAHHAGSSNVWYGIEFSSAVTVGKIRFVPRQSPAVGLKRAVGNVFECADDIEFTDPVRLAVVPDDAALGGVLEFTLPHPVTARFFRISHRFQKDSYISVSELEFCPTGLKKPIAVSVGPSDFTNMSASVVWSVPAENQCTTAAVERAYSPEGPFTEVSGWSDATAGGTFRDRLAPIGIACYYRVKTWCEGGLSRMFRSDPVKYVRSRRLERDPTDLAALKKDVSVIYPYRYMSILYAGSLTAAKNAFDGDAATYTDYSVKKDDFTYANAAIGVDLGSACHIAYAYVYPRSSEYTTILERARQMAVFGANTVDLSDRCQLSPLFGGFEENAWQYNATTNTTDAFRYVFLFSPTGYSTYGNVSEVGFYGFTDGDVADSGIPQPSENFTATAKSGRVDLAWGAGRNVVSYAVDRRKAGESAWTRIASGLGSGTRAWRDDDPALGKGVYEYRLAAVAGTEEVWAPRTSCVISPRRALTLVIQ